MGLHRKQLRGIMTLLELVDELVDELVLQRKQLFGLRRFPRKTTRTWRLIFIFVRGHYSPEAKVVKGSVEDFV